MKIELASNYGFCFGVKRAIKMAENAKDASTIGPLIHNNEEINRLKINFNVKTLNGISELQDEKKVIIRTHGIPKNDLEKLNASKIDVIDATCPFVTKPQQICEKMSQDGYDIVIFGDENHPEVKGVKSYANGNVFVILEEEELENIKLSQKVAVVSQTTRKVEKFMQIVNYLISRVKEVRVFNTICNATFENQEAVKNLSKKADVMIVIGGKNSSNTKQLYLIAKNFCEDSYLIESENEINSEWFEGKQLCGVSAGASTPDWIIQKVINKIEKI
ncbi:4-hydroxy-3-methylbut-2-enyl diphosphate reductase [Campylobacter pinnipediorum]|uniref:4-hydroxy-3-methylbut-2-enyl diphosphate reductase n=1 Tax=Campylobacter pinnipediorum subsp. pinnipediorum TaxID=1660067 RepID=A0AAX0LBC1_9BACT|nr:4-hydroxy-3-methylbut-2-enyl diphosphate reductase [Campylobacter pinnipediorum]AQW81072.1 1-hydroxy-2-methyl-2-(E)-butenyl 4-diphosphate reductase [Campylobacter pinnipediorum subsp. pinnipediorum]AQW82690.1 1-hydroxy-2-methyl-2-(E)-butenyl 4-diphosphate reductase [Campylobacter pinnipediorum subsp. pinnipediorum]AQW84377.1 1-hydroxy-2-methyl-2-(E)-butenyl 4-diphosphate reductase [Campylobacter pinnipediorum subsp. pinnipediorum]OPA77185.1 4-hydroxy-3-methylbut-2-enyl diphosphate reductase 